MIHQGHGDKQDDEIFVYIIRVASYKEEYLSHLSSACANRGYIKHRVSYLRLALIWSKSRDALAIMILAYYLEVAGHILDTIKIWTKDSLWVCSRPSQKAHFKFGLLLDYYAILASRWCKYLIGSPLLLAPLWSAISPISLRNNDLLECRPWPGDWPSNHGKTRLWGVHVRT